MKINHLSNFKDFYLAPLLPLQEGKVSSDSAGNLFGAYISDMSQKTRKLQDYSLKMLSNDVDFSEFVSLVAEYELKLKLLINVRDQITSAFNEIIKMQV